MNRKCLIILISALFLMMSSTSFASMFDDMQLGPKVGLHWPIGDYGDIADLGLTVGGQLKAPVNEKWSWGVNLTYASTSGDERDAITALEVTETSFDVTMFELYPFLDYYIKRGYEIKDGQADVFLRGGLGFNFWEVDIDQTITTNGNVVRTSGSNDDMDVMLVMGAGANFMGNFEAVALYNRILTGDFDEEYFTFTIGYNFDLAVNQR